MLLRQDERGVLAIGQPSHAWVSGQLARAWGNERFGPVEPREEVCLAAEQHDIGMAAWDISPTFNPASGMPYGFTEMPLAEHLECWRTGPPRLARQSRLAALLCSLHGTRLYAMRDLDRMPPDEADAVRKHVDDARAFQASLRATLGHVDDATIMRGSDLVWTWDFMSLALCLGWPPCTASRVPAAGGSLELAMTPGGSAGEVMLDPWPMGVSRLAVRCEGQRLAGPYADADALARAVGSAPWERLEFTLVAAR
jgi:hypothetical protein